MADPAVIDLFSAFTAQHTKRGVQRGYRVDFEVSPILVDIDGSRMLMPYAEAWKEAIVEELDGINELASDATIDRRKRYARDKSSKSYRKRYAGGRIGETPPGAGRRLFSDSQRMRNNLAIRTRRRTSAERAPVSMTLNFPGNRFDPRTFDGDHAEAFERLKRLVPSLGGKLRGKAAERVKEATQGILRDMVATNKRQLDQLRRKRNAALLNLARAFAGAF